MEIPVQIDAGSVRLEGRLALPAGATAACVLAHPHPLYGGSMDNNVVVAVARELAAIGLATLRFNFRGVGGSTGTHDGGRGEADDLRAAAAFLADAAGTPGVSIAAYSFGAAVALAIATDENAAIDRIAAIAPPLAMGAVFPPDPKRPILLLAGDRDTYCPRASIESLAAAHPGKVIVSVISGADHFFFGREQEIARAVAAFLAS